MAQDCPLPTPSTLKDTQSGFAGETGTVWTIAPDCSFTVARQIGLKTLDPHNQGRLTSDQQAQLKQSLDRMAAANLPNQLGGAPQVNARQITLAYGGKQAMVTLPPGGGDLSARSDQAVTEAYDGLGHTFDFYLEMYQRNSMATGCR
jgi:hypothetical protein